MDSMRGSSAYNVPSGSTANPAKAAPATVGTHLSVQADPLLPRLLSDHSAAALNAKATQGNEQEKILAGFAEDAIRSGQLKLFTHECTNGTALFERQRNHDHLAIKAKLNSNCKYDVLDIEFRRSSAEPMYMRLPAPPRRSTSPLEYMPKELIHMILDNVPNAGPQNRVTSLALSSRRLYALGLEKTLEKAKCAALLDRLAIIQDIPKRQGPDGYGGARLVEFKAVLGRLDEFRGREKMDLIGGLLVNIPRLSAKSIDGFKSMVVLAENICRSELPKSVDSEHRVAQMNERNKVVANLVSKLASSRVFSAAKDAPELFDRLCAILETLQGINGANHTAAALPELADWYAWRPKNIGLERFGKLIALADRNKLNTSDSFKSDVVASLPILLELHDKAEDIANHFNILCEISRTIKKDEIKSGLVTGLTRWSERCNNEAVRKVGKNFIADAIGTIQPPMLKARAAAVMPGSQDG